MSAPTHTAPPATDADVLAAEGVPIRTRSGEKRILLTFEVIRQVEERFGSIRGLQDALASLKGEGATDGKVFSKVLDVFHALLEEHYPGTEDGKRALGRDLLLSRTQEYVNALERAFSVSFGQPEGGASEGAADAPFPGAGSTTSPSSHAASHPGTSGP